MKKNDFIQFLEKHFSRIEKPLRLGRRTGTDRRLIEDRRTAESEQYLPSGSVDKRKGSDRRVAIERRQRWSPPTYWKQRVFD